MKIEVGYKITAKALAAIVVVVAFVLPAGCSKPEAASSPPSSTQPAPTGNYRSDQNYQTLELPPGWGVAEGPFMLSKAPEGRIGFNSWGQSGFWPSPGIMGPYNSESIIERILAGGAYVALIRIWVPPSLPEETPEYAQNDLTGLLTEHDWRKDSVSGVKSIPFYKWGRYFELDIYCSPSAPDETVAELNTLLTNWRFDAVPAGDEEWASLQARNLLPKKAKPEWFPIRPGSMGFQDSEWTTESEAQDKTVHIRFIYAWGGTRLPRPIPDNYNFPSSHWWRIDVLPTGKAVLVGEGGARLP